jgi:hypothetical protein
MKVRVEFEKGSVSLVNGRRYKVENNTFEIDPSDIKYILNDARFEIIDDKKVEDKKLSKRGKEK